MLASHGVEVTYERVRRWASKFGQAIARRILGIRVSRGNKWHLDGMIVKINRRKHWLWRAIDQHGAVLDVSVEPQRNTRAAKRLVRKLLKTQGFASRVFITDKLRSYGAANQAMGLTFEHRQHKGLNGIVNLGCPASTGLSWVCDAPHQARSRSGIKRPITALGLAPACSSTCVTAWLVDDAACVKRFADGFVTRISSLLGNGNR